MTQVVRMMVRGRVEERGGEGRAFQGRSGLSGVKETAGQLHDAVHCGMHERKGFNSPGKSLQSLKVENQAG